MWSSPDPDVPLGFRFAIGQISEVIILRIIRSEISTITRLLAKNVGIFEKGAQSQLYRWILYRCLLPLHASDAKRIDTDQGHRCAK
jgi:hypothetical protein